nr:RNA-directed DNA polymerase, eukaryota [Tanacetum cinerariifolium]
MVYVTKSILSSPMSNAIYSGQRKQRNGRTFGAQLILHHIVVDIKVLYPSVKQFSDQISNNLSFIHSASALWLELQERYSQLDGHGIYQLTNEIPQLKQVNCTTEMYYQKLKGLWDEIDALEASYMCNCNCVCANSRLNGARESRKRPRTFNMVIGQSSGQDGVSTSELSTSGGQAGDVVFAKMDSLQNQLNQVMMMLQNSQGQFDPKLLAAGRYLFISSCLLMFKDAWVVDSGFKWVYRLKYNANGSVDKYKARLVAKGFTQQKGIDYTETFAPVAMMVTDRTLLVVCSINNWSVQQLDIKNAFFHGDLNEEVYMQVPSGYKKPLPPNIVCKLKKSLYGLKQANSIKDLGALHYYLGIEFLRNSNGIVMTQRKYALDFIECVNLQHEKPSKAPLDPRIKLTETDGDPLPDPSYYRTMVGKLIYLTISRPDLAFAAYLLSQFPKNPHTSHLQALQRVVKYIQLSPSQVCKTRTFALGDKPHSFFAPEGKPPRRGLNPRPLACDETRMISKSIFITNFPDSTASSDLWNLCQVYGTVVDVYIPLVGRKLGNVLLLFASLSDNVDRLVGNLCTLWIGRMHLHANVPAMVLDDSCMVTHDLGNYVMGEVKQFSSINNLRVLLSNEGFHKVQLVCLGGSWVMIKLKSSKSKAKFLNHVGVASWIVWVDIEGVPMHAWSRNTFYKIGSKWGEVLELEECRNDFFSRKRICIKTKQEDNILEKFKIIVKGKIFVVRAKELFVWSSTFKDVPEMVYCSDDDSAKKIDELGNVADSEISNDHFNIYDLLNKHDKEVDNTCTDSSIPFPPGFTPVKDIYKKAEHDMHADQVRSHSKSKGCNSRILEDAQKIDEHFSSEVGQTMGFSMDGCTKDMEKIIGSQGVHETKMDSISAMKVKFLWGNSNFEHLFSEALGSSGEGYTFTWAHPSATKMSKLDRFLVTDGLLSLFPHVSAVCLDRHLLDHRPILLREVITDYGATLFRLYHSWFSLHGFEHMVTHTWNSTVLNDSNGMIRFKKKLQILKKEIRAWVADQKKKQSGCVNDLKSKLSDIDKTLDQGGVNDDLLLPRMECVKQLHDVKTTDARDSMQKAKIQWAIEGDENSKFFHGIINRKRVNLAVKCIMIDGEWVDDPSRVKDEFHTHFAARFQDPGICHGRINFSFPNRLNLQQATDLENPITRDEIRNAVWGCGENKSLGPDGFTFEFLRCNSSFIALIQKSLDPKSDDTVDKLKGRLSKWKLKTLSFGSRLTLLKSVLGSTPIYNMSLYKVPKTVLNSMEAIRRNFFNGIHDDEKKVAWVKWSKELSASHSSTWSSILKEINILKAQVRGGAESLQLAHLLDLLGPVILSNMEDRWIWDMNGDGVFRVKDVLILLDEVFLSNDATPTRWIKSILIKVNVFAWKVSIDRLSTHSNLSRRGVVVPSLSCPICNLIHEDTAHLVFSCGLASEVMRLVCRWWNLVWIPPNSYPDWLSWFKSLRMSSNVKGVLEGVFLYHLVEYMMFQESVSFCG